MAQTTLTNSTTTTGVGGHCVQCSTLNQYSSRFCGSCGARLPWGDALAAAGAGTPPQAQESLPGAVEASERAATVSASTSSTAGSSTHSSGNSVSMRCGLNKAEKFALGLLTLFLSPFVATLALMGLAWAFRAIEMGGLTRTIGLLYILTSGCLLAGLIYPQAFAALFRGHTSRWNVARVFLLATVPSLLYMAGTVPLPQTTTKADAIEAVRTTTNPPAKPQLAAPQPAVHKPVVRKPAPQPRPKHAATVTKAISRDEVQLFMDAVRLADSGGVLVDTAQADGDYLTVTVTGAWHTQNYQNRLQLAQSLWKIWAGIHSPSDLDQSRIKIVDFNGNRVGGSGIVAGSLVGVDD